VNFITLVIITSVISPAHLPPAHLPTRRTACQPASHIIGGGLNEDLFRMGSGAKMAPGIGGTLAIGSTKWMSFYPYGNTKCTAKDGVIAKVGAKITLSPTLEIGVDNVQKEHLFCTINCTVNPCHPKG